MTPESSTVEPLLCVFTRTFNDGGWSTSLPGAYFKDYGEIFAPFHFYSTRYTYRMFCLGPDIAIVTYELDVSNIIPD